MTATVSLPDSPAMPLTDGGGGSLRRILVPVDSFGNCTSALATGARLACAIGGELRVVHIRAFDPPLRNAGRFYVESSSDATAVIDRAVTGAWQSGCRASGVVLDAERSAIARTICKAASDWKADVIILARRPRRAISILLLGSVGHQVMRLARCPVLAVRPLANAVVPRQPTGTDQP
jgi:nucleotide-binding universal stress UspA family protein